MKITYHHLPSRMWFCKATRNCCYEIVSYNPESFEIASKIDKDSYDLDSGTLACECHPTLDIVSIEEEEYR